MPYYEWEFSADPGEEKFVDVSIEGDVLSYVAVRFPPGPAALLEVAIYYGIYKLFPHESSEYFRGNDEKTELHPNWPLPEQKTTLRIYLHNKSTSHVHRVYIKLETKWRKDTLPELIAKSLMDAFRMLFRVF